MLAVLDEILSVQPAISVSIKLIEAADHDVEVVKTLRQADHSKAFILHWQLPACLLRDAWSTTEVFCSESFCRSCTL